MIGQGKMGNGDLNNISPQASVQYIPFGIFLGFSYKKFRLGYDYEYVYANQTTSPSEVNYTNTSGQEQSSGIRLDYYNGQLSVGVIYKSDQNFKLTQKTGNGLSSEYKSNNSYAFQVMYHLRKRVGVILDYSQCEYNESLPDANVKSNRLSIGLVLSNFKVAK